jgi:signal transduction histidine kinase
VAVAFAYLIVTPLILLIRRYRVPHPMVTIGTLIIAGSEVIGLTGSLFAIPFPLLTMGVAAGISILGISMVHYQLLKPLRDTTRKLEARQADLKERNRRLEEANSKLQELDEWKEKMTHMVIHDVKSPLNVINVVLTDFRNNLSAGMDSTQQQLLQSALISAHRVQSLVSSMLDVRRLEEGRLPIKPVPFDLRSIIDDSLQALNPLLTLHDISVDVHFSTPIPMADGDPDVIARVIENLVDNAAKFSPSPGTVAIELSAETDELRFSISDCGPGIPPAYQERVFEKFFRITSEAQDTRSGVGLGLAFCKLALEAQGGYIWVESDGHSGTAFHFSLPAWQEPAGNPNPVSGTVSQRND